MSKTAFQLKFGKYLPISLIERITKLQSLNKPEMESIEAVVAIVDVSGFTKLSETLANAYKEDGAEMLNRYISSYFEELIKTIIDFGGDIIKFAGDAMIVVWKSRNTFDDDFDQAKSRKSKKNLKKMMLGDDKDAASEPIEFHVFRAVACALALHQRYNNFRPVETDEAICLMLHSGVAVGSLHEIIVGGVEDSWEFFVAGEPIKKMSAAGAEAQPGELYVSNEAFQFIKGWVSEYKIAPSGNVKIMKLSSDIGTPALYKFPLLSKNQEDLLIRFIPSIVRQRLEEIQLNEFDGQYRKAFVMFVKLHGLEYEKSGVLEKLQSAVVEIQNAVSKYEGTIARLLADDKGTRFKIVFGLPRQVHEDNAVRIVLTAIEISSRLAGIGTKVSIGIAHGNLFCGDAGSSLRSEYTAVGLQVNIAARIMAVAEKTEIAILCDEKTQTATSSVFEWKPQKPVLVKGISEPIVLFYPAGKQKSTNSLRPKHSKNQHSLEFKDSKSLPAISYRHSIHLRRASFMTKGTGLIGRGKELDDLKEAIENVSSSQKSNVTLLEGPSGIGKTTLILQLMESQMNDPNIRILYSQTSRFEKASSFGIWKKIFKGALDMNSNSSNTKSDADAEMILSPYIEGFTMMISILNVIFDTTFPESYFIAQMSPDGKSEYLRKMLVQIFSKFTQEQTVVAILDNMNLADSFSWNLAFDIAISVPNCFLILSTRPLDKPWPLYYTNIRSLSTANVVELRLLTKSETTQLAIRKLNVSFLQQSVAELVYEKSQGNPLFAEELIQALVDQKFVEIRNKSCIPQDKLLREEFKSFPDSLHQVVTTRIDQLSSKLQLTLKVCSVISQEDFGLKIVAAAHPMFDTSNLNESQLCELNEYMQDLESAGFIVKTDSEETDNAIMYSFTNHVFQEVAYEMLLLKQKIEIHYKVLCFLEESFRFHKRYFQLLAHHALKAQLYLKALDYSEQAGLYAMEENANEEAVELLTNALKLYAQLDLHDSLRLEKCHVNLGEALYSLGRYDESIENFLWALDLTGNPVPKGTFTLRIKTTKSAASQRLRDVLSWDPRSRSKKEAASTFRAASIMQRLCQACLMNGNLDLAGYCAFTLVELCETSEQGQGNLLVIGYSLCGYMSLIMGNLDFAESYSTKATTIISNFPHLPEVDKAIAQNQLGMYRAAYGNWNEALNLFRSAKKIFKNYGERKKWRESTLMIGIVLHMQGEFEECKRHFDKLLNFAQEDGDLYLQSNALLWKALTDLQVEGASRTLDTSLAKALAIQNEIQADSIVVRVTIGYNLGEILGWPENKITFDAMTALRSSSLDTVIQFATERMIKELTKSTNLLWYNIYKYVNSLNALFDACERCTVEEKSKRDQFINAAEQVLKSFAKSFPFPYAKSYKKFLQARYEFLNNQERTGRRHMLKAAREALSTKMPFVQAASLYHIACHQEGAKRDQNLELARMIFVQHKVKINQHSHFKALWQDRDNAIDQDDKVDEMIPENFDLDKIIESELEQESASRQSLGIRASTLARRSTTKKPVPLFTSSRSRESESLPSKTFTM